MKSTWLLLSNASRAQIVATDPNLDAPQRIETFAHPQSRLKGTELSADDRGRTQPRNKDAVRGAALARTSSPQDVEAERFARELAEHVRLARTRNLYQDLLLVAPPEFLGLLRAHLDDATTKTVVGEIAKDYTDERPEMAIIRVLSQMGKA